MNTLMWTVPPEMTTAATNLVIVCICTVCAIRIGGIKQTNALKKALWLAFFLIMIPTGVFGFFVHAIVLEPETKRIAWIFLSVMLGLTTTVLSITMFYELFGRSHIKKIVVISIAAEIVFAAVVYCLSGIVPNIHLVFIAYTGVVISIIFVFLVIKRKVRPHFRWYIAAILVVVVGGLFELCGDFTVSVIWEFDQGSACHLCIAAALCLFAVGCSRECVCCDQI